MKITTLVLFIFVFVFVGCEQKQKQEQTIKSDPKPPISSSENYILVGDEILNKNYIVRIAAPINRALYSGRKLEGYGLDVILKYNTSTAFLGGSASDTRVRLFYGTYEECIAIQKQIVLLLD